MGICRDVPCGEVDGHYTQFPSGATTWAAVGADFDLHGATTSQVDVGGLYGVEESFNMHEEEATEHQSCRTEDPLQGQPALQAQRDAAFAAVKPDTDPNKYDIGPQSSQIDKWYPYIVAFSVFKKINEDLRGSIQ
jgi:hypothetical protein